MCLVFFSIRRPYTIRAMPIIRKMIPIIRAPNSPFALYSITPHAPTPKPSSMEAMTKTMWNALSDMLIL